MPNVEWRIHAQEGLAPKMVLHSSATIDCIRTRARPRASSFKFCPNCLIGFVQLDTGTAELAFVDKASQSVNGTAASGYCSFAYQRQYPSNIIVVRY